MSKSFEYKITLLKLNISQRDIAKMLNLSDSYVSMIIAGKRKSTKFDKLIALLTEKDCNEVVG